MRKRHASQYANFGSLRIGYRSLDAAFDGKSFLACTSGSIFGFYRIACQYNRFRIGLAFPGSRSGKAVAEE